MELLPPQEWLIRQTLEESPRVKSPERLAFAAARLRAFGDSSADPETREAARQILAGNLAR